MLEALAHSFEQLYRFSFPALGGTNELQLYAFTSSQAEAARDAVITEVRRIEQKFSRYRDDSVTTLINSAAGKTPVPVDVETAALLDYADACHRQSDGLFDITSGILRKVWNFRSPELPTRNSVQRLLPLIGWQKVNWKNSVVFLPKAGMEIDFGGIGKEYAVDRCTEIIVRSGIRSALVNLAGDVRMIGKHADGKPWRIGISHPSSPETTLASVALEPNRHLGAAATSGDYERCIRIRGRRYSHLLNPRTGWPVSGLQSVTVLAPTCLIAGSITTTALLLEKKGEGYLEEIGVPYLLVRNDGSMKKSF